MEFREKKVENGVNEIGSATPACKSKLSTSSISNCSSDKDSGHLHCRVCHCVESDFRGNAALGFLGIVPPFHEHSCISQNRDLSEKTKKNFTNDVKFSNWKVPGFMELVSPEGEVFVCRTDVESGYFNQEDTLISLGCLCKNELALVHYACALKWFINHGSTICEICGTVAKNVRPADFKKVLASLKDYEALREKTATGEIPEVDLEANTIVDPDAVAGIRRQRLFEISSWFGRRDPQVAVSQEQSDLVFLEQSNNSGGDFSAREEADTRWAMESTGALVAVGLVIVILVWLVAPHVGKKAASVGLHLLLGGLCALTIMVFIRFVIPRVNYGPTRIWAILFVFWFLAFGVWASRTHSIRSS